MKIEIKSGIDLKQMLLAKVSIAQSEISEQMTMKIAQNLGKRVKSQPVPIIEHGTGKSSVVINSTSDQVNKDAHAIENEITKISKVAMQNKTIVELFRELGI